MAGPIPKAAALKRSPRKRHGAPRETLLVHDPERPIPPLPQVRAWRDETIAWWLAVWSSPVSVQWSDVDTHAVEQLALLLDRWYGEIEDGGDMSGRLSAEIRQRQCELGLTPQSRARMGWQVAESRGVNPSLPAGTYEGLDGIVKPKPQTASRAVVGGEDDPRALLGRQGNVVPIRKGA
jgi:hypothetical protein